MSRRGIRAAGALALVLALLLPLVPPARADDQVAPSVIAGDIRISPPPTHKDGLVSFTDSPIILRETAENGSETRRVADTTIRALLNERCRALTESKHGVAIDLDYIAYVTLSPAQGTLYGGYNAESDPGDGLAGTVRYYYDENVATNNKISDIQFVPAAAFAGEARITYYGYYSFQTAGENGVSTKNIGSYTGNIYISVTKQVPGISYSTDGEPIRFSTDDFATYSNAVTGRTFRYVTFMPPKESEGTLYYNYRDGDIYDYAVEEGQRFYRATKPLLSNVYFVPSKNAPAVVDLQFHLVDIAERSPDNEPEDMNHVNITLTAFGPQHTPSGGSGGGTVNYDVIRGRSVTLDAAALSAKCLSETGSTLDYIRFTALPGSGTLYDTSSSSSNANRYVAVNKAYRNPGIIRYAADEDFVGTLTVPIVVYADNGKWFDATIGFVVRDSATHPLRYTIDPGKRVYFLAEDFSDACFAATGYDIYRIQFRSLPSSAYGTLYNNGTPITANGSNTYYYKGSLSNLSFLASANFDTSVTIPFTGYASGYTSANARSFSGTITVMSSAMPAEEPEVSIGGTSNTITYHTSQFPTALRKSDILSAASEFLPGTPTALTFDRADANAGSLQYNMRTLLDRTAFDPRRTYGIDDVPCISFLPKPGFSGTTRIGYTAKDADGNSFLGNIEFVVTPRTQSIFFVDLSSYAWATPAIDFLRTYGVTAGVSPKYFAPALPMRRGDFILLLSRACGFPNAGTSSFQDVPEDAYYAAAIASAKSMGLVSGTAKGLFYPDDTITREEAFTYLFRALQRYRGTVAGSAANLTQFSDTGDISPVAVPAMGALVRLGVLQGDNGRLYPTRQLTRAETMTILYRAFT
ncbi:MAG: S-layer homology domain-containing protein [Oscillospiraceae bacterium]|nr:S-layer homology domain-containing protein [Oscillospiraceae bacterium]